MGAANFEIEKLIEDCREAIAKGDDVERAVRAIVEEAIHDPAPITQCLGGEREDAGLKTLYRDATLTIIDFAWAPWMCFKPHTHNMWSIVGLITGREDNVFWRRLPDKNIEAAGARSLGAGDVTILGADIIHSVTNPVGKFTRAIHIYGGDFFAPLTPRSEWDPETLIERPWDMDHTRKLFAEAEARFRRTPTSA